MASSPLSSNPCSARSRWAHRELPGGSPGAARGFPGAVRGLPPGGCFSHCAVSNYRSAPHGVRQEDASTKRPSPQLVGSRRSTPEASGKRADEGPSGRRAQELARDVVFDQASEGAREGAREGQLAREAAARDAAARATAVAAQLARDVAARAERPKVRCGSVL